MYNKYSQTQKTWPYLSLASMFKIQLKTFPQHHGRYADSLLWPPELSSLTLIMFRGAAEKNFRVKK